jgi:pimeloyl-ACP methyl ester carboxylesterase
MPSFTSRGVSLAYDDFGAAGARPLVLIHGFSSNRHEGWRRTGWYAALERRGMRGVAIDLLGHGESDKPHDPAAYAGDLLFQDVLALLDQLEVEEADLFGFSMGARVALGAALAAPERVSNLILGGVGGRWFEPLPEGPGPGEMTMSEAMLAEDVEAIHPPLARSFRQFADEQGEDRQALAAFLQAERPSLDLDRMWGLQTPVLVVAGAHDELAGDPENLARAFPNGRGIILAGCDHFSAIAHGMTKAAVFDFLDGLLDWEGP